MCRAGMRADLADDAATPGAEPGVLAFGGDGVRDAARRRPRLSERAEEDGPHEGESGARGNNVDVTRKDHGCPPLQEPGSEKYAG